MPQPWRHLLARVLERVRELGLVDLALELEQQASQPMQLPCGVRGLQQR